MTASERVNEFIYNMKLKKSIIGGIKEESVYENMQKIRDIYETQMNDEKEQMKVLKDKSDKLEQEINKLEQDFNNLKQAHEQELHAVRSNCVSVLTSHQSRMNQFLESCIDLSEDVKKAIEECQP